MTLTLSDSQNRYLTEFTMCEQPLIRPARLHAQTEQSLISLRQLSGLLNSCFECIKTGHLSLSESSPLSHGVGVPFPSFVLPSKMEAEHHFSNTNAGSLTARQTRWWPDKVVNFLASFEKALYSLREQGIL